MSAIVAHLRAGAVALLTVLMLAWAVAASEAATYYVATTGSNSNNGAIGTPWLTLAYAMADAQVNCGDTIYVRGGTYVSIDTQAAPALTCASFASPLTVSAYTGEAVSMPGIGVYAERYFVITAGTGTWFLTGQPNGSPGETISIGGGYSPSGMGGGYIRFVALDIHGNNTVFFGTPGSPPADPFGYYGDSGPVVSFSQGSAGHNEILGGKIHDCASYGSSSMATAISVYNTSGGRRPGMAHAVYVESPSNLVAGVEMYYITQYAIHNVFGDSSSNIYERLFVHHVGTANVTMFAVYLGTGTSNVLRNSVIAWNTNGLQGGGTSNLFYNNTVAFNGLSGSCGSGQYAQCYPAAIIQGTGAELKNNIFYGNYDDTVGDFGTGTVQTTNSSANPAFTNGSGNYTLATDFNLQASSALRDVGTTLASVTSDYIVTARPQNAFYDIGAFEFIVGGGAPVGTLCTPSQTFSLIGHTAKGSTTGYTVTTTGFDTTNACEIVVAVADDQAGSVVFSDYYNNDWEARTAREVTGNMRVQFYDCVQPCLGGVNHTFTATGAFGAIAYPAIAVAAVTGTTTTPYVSQAGATSAGATTLATGSYTPGVNNTVLFTALAYDVNAGATVNGSFILLDATTTVGTDYGIGLAYLLQETSAAVNPLWTVSVSSGLAATIAAYARNGGGSGPTPPTPTVFQAYRRR